MTRKFLLSGFGALLFLFSGLAQAAVITLEEYAFNIDGTVSDPTLGDPVPAAADISGFNTGTGLGTIVITITGAGLHDIVAFFDHEIDEAINSFFNEIGATAGAAAAGQSWEIDEPGFAGGDIYDNFEISSDSLDNSIGFPFEDDVSMAMGWAFNLDAGETATISFFLSDVDAPAGFSLWHSDPASDATIFLSSSLDITGGPIGVPEPGTLWLLGAGLLGLGLSRRRNLANS